MKFLVVLAVAVACASAVDDYNAQVVKSNLDISPEGSYRYDYETSNGIFGQAQGNVKNQNSEYPSLEVQGAFKYTAPDGQNYELVYTADENGFQPQGNHLPVSPPIPEGIARALAYIAAHPPPADGVRAVPKPAYG